MSIITTLNTDSISGLAGADQHSGLTPNCGSYFIYKTKNMKVKSIRLLSHIYEFYSQLKKRTDRPHIESDGEEDVFISRRSIVKSRL